MKTAEWYFDFVSPFSYLQLERFDRLPPDVEVTLRPVVFAGLLDHLQHKGPAEIPGKRRFTYRFVQWLAQKEGIDFKFPPAHPFNPIRPLRLAIACGSGRREVQQIFRFIWRDGRSTDDAAAWDALTHALGVTDAETRINDPQVKSALRANGERAIAAGVFGVPSFVIGAEVFWGFDATGMAIDYLNDPAAFASAEMARVSGLPVAAERPRR